LYLSDALLVEILNTPGDAIDQPDAGASGDGHAAEVGILVPLSGAVSLDLGFFFGTGQAHQDVIGRINGTLRGVEKVDLDLFGGDAAIRLYPIGGDRVRPWVALGIRNSIARPSGGRVDFADGPSTEIPKSELDTAHDTSAFVRGGIDLRWSEKGRATLSGAYEERGSWTARLGVGFAVGGAARRSVPAASLYPITK
jgi:hypothetical protein